MTEKPFTVAQVAERWDKTVPDVMEMIKAGELKAFSVSPQKRLTPSSARITHDAVTRYLEGDPAPTIDLIPVLVGLIYVITCGDHFKIGFTGHATVGRRMSSLQTANPTPLALWATLPGSMRLESELHARYRKFRGRGEWFALDDDARWDLAELVRGRGGMIFGG